MILKRKKRATSPTPAPSSPALDEARERIAEMISDADRRVDAMLSRLRARESLSEEEPAK